METVVFTFEHLFEVLSIGILTGFLFTFTLWAVSMVVIVFKKIILH